MRPKFPAPFGLMSAIGYSFLLLASGCASLNLPEASPFPSATSSPRLIGVPAGVEGSGTGSMSVYQKVREARGQNSVVLQVAGEDEPLRVLPLPSDDRSVFASTLLEQSGVLKKLGTVEATLFRFSSEAVGGIPMKVQMNESKTMVRPESDYALQPGDRLFVRKVDFVAIKSLLSSALGI